MSWQRSALLVAVFVCALVLGYGEIAKAWPTPYNRGYFTNTLDASGVDVWPDDSDTPGCAASAANDALPASVNTANEFISFVRCKLTSTNNYAPYRARERTGAAFIIQTMLGDTGSKITSTSDPRVAEWEEDVRMYAAMGWVNWNATLNYGVNTYFQGTNSSASPNDDAAFSDPGGSGQGIRFSGPGGTYEIRRQCANPVGVMQDIHLPEFALSGTSSVNVANPTADSDVVFTHNVHNDGPQGTSPVTITRAAYTTLPTSGTAVAPNNSGTYTNGQTKSFTHTVHIPAGTPAGTRFCEQVGWDPVNSNGGRNGRGTPACATVVNDFDLLPTVVPSADVAQDGDTVTFTYRIANDGNSPSDPAQCYVRDGAGAAVTVTLSCAASQVFAGGGAPVTVGTESVTVTNQAPGTAICRRLYVQPASATVANRPSEQECVTVGKTPYVHFGGNDVWAGGGFPAVNPACSTSAKITTVGRALGGTSPTQYAGSSVEYSAYALNRITSFGSAGRVLVGNGALGDIARSMTFANNEADPARLGFYGAAQHCMQDYSSLYASLPAGGAQPITSAQSGAWRVVGAHSLGGNVQAGVSKAYYVEGDITITGSIAYPNSYANVAAIPSVVVVATGNIYVAPGVTRLDGLYVARGGFYTCYPKVEPATVGTCNQQLIVNGAVKATNIDLFRTAGADGPTPATRKEPAELFNFTPELYIRNALDATQRPTIQVLNSIELPPRF